MGKPLKVTLKKGKDKAVKNRHPWIFAGALAGIGEGIKDGSVVTVSGSGGEILGSGYYNSRSQIAVRMLTFGPQEVNRDLFRERIAGAVRQRSVDAALAGTDAYRLVYSENDGIPGLIVDKYGRHLVMQVLTLGIEAWRDDIASILSEECGPAGIYERSDHPGRAIEGMDDRCGQISGTTPDEIEISENGARFLVDVKGGQKTGFFLDQRENRSVVRTFSSGKRVLNLFSYTGGFTVAAFMGGAESVTSVDTSGPSLELMKKNLSLNGCTGESIEVRENAFEFARNQGKEYDFIIVDPPALVKKKNDMMKGSRAYKDINMHVFRKCPAGSLVLTCSCSRFVDGPLFQKIIFSAMLDSGRWGKILYKGAHPSDHPVSLFHPESEYLKSMLVYVE